MNLGFTGYRYRVIGLTFLAWGGGFWGPAFLRGPLLSAEVELCQHRAAPAQKHRLKTLSLHVWWELQSGLCGKWPGVPNRGRAVRLAPTAPQGGQNLLGSAPPGATSICKTAAFQVMASLIRVTISLWAADELAIVILMICLWLSYWEFNFFFFFFYFCLLLFAVPVVQHYIACSVYNIMVTLQICK